MSFLKIVEHFGNFSRKFFIGRSLFFLQHEKFWRILENIGKFWKFFARTRARGALLFSCVCARCAHYRMLKTSKISRDLSSFFLILLYIGLIPFGSFVLFWGPVTAMRKSKNPKIKKVTIVQVTPAGGFDGVATIGRKKAKI